MSNKINPVVKADANITVSFNLTEAEARALHDLTGYGAEIFYEKFCKELGSHYINKNKDGFLSLWERLRTELPQAFHKIDEIKKLQSQIQEIAKK